MLQKMVVTLRGRNIALLVVFFCGASLVLALIQSQRSGKAIFPRKSSSLTSSTLKSSQRVDAGGPALPVPLVHTNWSNIERAYTLEGMIKNMELLNFEQLLRNKEIFGDHRADDPIIVVQAHDRENFLKLLLESLSKVRGIESVTLVISRDKFTPGMDGVVDNHITFCRYLEVFFPFSMQLYPDKFPGEHPNDCPRDTPKNKARSKECNNAEYPDMYGHYREVQYVQLKHHWFWKLNMVFQGIRDFKGMSGPILILEDDNFVVPDLIDVMKKTVALRDSKCGDCLVITLGAYDSTTDYGAFGNVVDVKSWVSSKHNIGMVLDQRFFDQLSECAQYFCKYDDYNWDWTLQATALKCFSQPLYTLVTRVPRVYHLGCTGFHQKHGGICNVEGEVRRLKSVLDSEARNLYPENLEMDSVTKAPNPSHIQNGGWGDIRDHELCQKYRDLCKSYFDLGRRSLA